VLASPAFGRGDVRSALLDGFQKTETDLIAEQSAASAMFGSPLTSHVGERTGVGSSLDAMPPSGCCGCTALIVLLHSDSMHIAWLGDCRAVICSAGECRELTVDHSLLDQKERARALADGGVVEGNRLGGFLEVARALGDFDSAQGRKPAGLSARPELHSHPIREQDEFLILGSDGLWGAVDSADAVRLARAELAAYDGDAAMASEKLVEVALKRHADDNVSVMIVCLNLKAREMETPRRPRLMLARRSSSAGQATPSTSKSSSTANDAATTPSL
jgi:serine/threonine protein phosphatase PrpC